MKLCSQTKMTTSINQKITIFNLECMKAPPYGEIHWPLPCCKTRIVQIKMKSGIELNQCQFG